jgi:hypothetical protein
MKRYILPTVISLMASLPFAASAQNNFTGAVDTQMGTAGNWSSGLPTTLGDQGLIGSGDTVDFSAESGLFISQTGGLAQGTSFGWKNFDNMTYEITGGTLTATAFGLRMGNSSASSLTLGSTGTFNSSTLNVRGGSSFTMTGGTLNGAALRAVGGSTLDFSGGTADFSGIVFDQSANTSAVSFSGTASFTAGTFGNNTGTQNISIGLGSGSISATTLNSSSLSFDWTSGSDFTIIASSIDSGSTWEDLWTAGKLTVGGVSGSSFGDNFVDTAGTLSLVPEPSAFALLSGLLGLTWVMVLRR